MVAEGLFVVSHTLQIGWGYSNAETLQVNYYGPKRVNAAFLPLLQRPGGRVVNVGSAAGPMYVAAVPGTPLGEPWKMTLQQLDDYAAKVEKDGVTVDIGMYGASKALLGAYTHLYAKANPDLVVNVCSPGYIETDLTAAHGGNKKPPSAGAVPPVFLLLDEGVANEPGGRYYGSDCVRSPLDVYRGPGDPPYVSDADLVQSAEL